MSMYPDPRDSRTPAEKERDDARINEAIAEDVAVGESIRAEQERARANSFAQANTRQAVHLNEARLDRDRAVVNSAVARHDAQNSAFAFWLLLGTVLVMLGIGSIWYANRPEPTSTTTVINREVRATPAASRTSSAASAAQPAQTPVVTVPVPVPVTPAPAPTPQVVPVPVPVPVERMPAPQAAPSAAPTTSVEVTPAPDANSEDQPLRGYVVPDSTNSDDPGR